MSRVEEILTHLSKVLQDKLAAGGGDVAQDMTSVSIVSSVFLAILESAEKFRDKLQRTYLTDSAVREVKKIPNNNNKKKVVAPKNFLRLFFLFAIQRKTTHT